MFGSDFKPKSSIMQAETIEYAIETDVDSKQSGGALPLYLE